MDKLIGLKIESISYDEVENAVTIDFEGGIKIKIRENYYTDNLRVIQISPEHKALI